MEVGCPWIVSGVMEIVPGTLATRTVDRGSGSCDGTATVTINGITFTIVG